MKRQLLIPALFSVFVLSVSCGETEESNEDSTAMTTPDVPLAEAPSEWLGEEPHLVIMGTIDGWPVNIQLMDLDAAVEGMVPEIGYKREYEQVADGEIRYTQIEVEMKILLGGIERAIDFEFSNANLDDADMAEPFTVIEGENIYENGEEKIAVEGQDAAVILGMEWETADGEADVEMPCKSGMASFLLLEGTADDDGIVRAQSTDRIGGYLNLTTANDESVVISWTAFPLPDDEEISDGVELSAVDNFYE